jgi:hypothetical protein
MKTPSLLGREAVFPYSAEGAYPAGRKIRKLRTGFDAPGFVALGGIVDITTGIAYKFCHFVISSDCWPIRLTGSAENPGWVSGASYQFFPKTSK